MPDSYTKLLMKFDKGFLNIANYGTSSPSTIGDGIYLYCDDSGPFLGASSYLYISDSYSVIYAASSAWDLVGDFAIDFYVKVLSFPSNTNDFISRTSGWNVGCGAGGVFHFRDGTGATIFSHSSGWSLGIWYHIAITRSNGTYRFFRDGTLLATTTYLPEITNGSTLSFNHWSSGSYRLANVRISVDTARWTSNFTKPAYYHTADSFTKFLCTFEMDYVKRHNFIYSDGPSKQELNTKKWGRASWRGYSGAPNYGVSSIAGNTADFALGAGDFTFDFWCNLGDGSGSSYRIINLGSVYFEWVDTPYLRFRVGSIYLTTSITHGTWYHIAGVRSGSNCMLFKNGILQQSGTASDNISGTAITIGGSSSSYSFYLDELRLSKGIARWTSNFTPPTGEYLDYKLSGNASMPCTLTILNDATKVVEEERQLAAGNWIISPLTYNKKIIMAKLEDGETKCYGEVWPVPE